MNHLVLWCLTSKTDAKIHINLITYKFFAMNLTLFYEIIID